MQLIDAERSISKIRPTIVNASSAKKLYRCKSSLWWWQTL